MNLIQLGEVLFSTGEYYHGSLNAPEKAAAEAKHRALSELKDQSDILVCYDKDGDHQFMGDLNKSGGLCDCCSGDEDIVRYVGYKVEL